MNIPPHPIPSKFFNAKSNPWLQTSILPSHLKQPGAACLMCPNLCETPSSEDGESAPLPCEHPQDNQPFKPFSRNYENRVHDHVTSEFRSSKNPETAAQRMRRRCAFHLIFLRRPACNLLLKGAGSISQGSGIRRFTEHTKNDCWQLPLEEARVFIICWQSQCASQGSQTVSPSFMIIPG